MTERSYHSDRIIVHPGDCLEILASMPEASVDSVVTDPPYHFASIIKRWSGKGPPPVEGVFRRSTTGFMGKTWDGGQIAHDPATWAAVARVMKPGAHLVAFHAPKNWHRLACAIEDAGLEIRDTLLFLYGSGFPKSHNLDKKRGGVFCGCEALSERSLRLVRDADLSQAVDAADERAEVLQQGLSEQSLSQSRKSRPEPETARRAQSGMERRSDLSQAARELCVGEVCPVPASSADDGTEGRKHNGTSLSDGGVDRSPAFANGGGASSRSRAAEQSSQQSGTVAGQSKPQARGAWPICDRCGKPIISDGLGSALKPAYEPIVLARKPLQGTIAANVMAHGTGAINIDGCRVETDPMVDDPRLGGKGDWSSDKMAKNVYEGGYAGVRVGSSALGRWPANVVHDGSDEVLGAFPDSQQGDVRGDEPSSLTNNCYGQFNGRPATAARGDSGSAARFFYSAKADADDRIGSKHPTVKPIDLMQWLVRLVTPPKGVILDPFAGTGTTGEAALREGFRAILIEREAEYLADIERRMAHAFDGEVGRSVAMAKLKPEGEPLPLFAEAAE